MLLSKLTKPVVRRLNKVLLENRFEVKKDEGIALKGRYFGNAKKKVESIERLNEFFKPYKIIVKDTDGAVSMTPSDRLGDVVLLAYRERYFGQKSN